MEVAKVQCMNPMASKEHCIIFTRTRRKSKMLPNHLRVALRVALVGQSRVVITFSMKPWGSKKLTPRFGIYFHILTTLSCWSCGPCKKEIYCDVTCFCNFKCFVIPHVVDVLYSNLQPFLCSMTLNECRCLWWSTKCIVFVFFIYILSVDWYNGLLLLLFVRSCMRVKVVDPHSPLAYEVIGCLKGENL